MPEIDILAENQLNFRRKKRETQSTFAYKCGISEEELSLLERRKTDPKLSTLQNIAAYTGETVSDLLKTKDMTGNRENEGDE